MIAKTILRQLLRPFKASIVLTAVILILVEPERAMEGALQGLSLCCRVIIPSLFPFLVLSRLLLESALAGPLGNLLFPYTRSLGIGSKKAASALLCGLLGGFAAGSSAVSQLYDAGEISDREAERLLVCCIGSSPAFIVGSVGTAMLKSASAGWLLFAAQVTASLVCGWLFRRSSVASAASAAPTKSGKKGFAHAIEKAVSAISILCGYVIFFSCLTALMAPSCMPAFPRFVLTLFLEVTNACSAGASVPQARLWLCSIALSIMGLSVLFQVRTLTGAKFSLQALVLSRIPHTFLSLLFLRGLLWLFPLSLPASSAPSLIARRMPYDVICILFVLCALAVCRTKPFIHLPSHRNGV